MAGKITVRCNGCAKTQAVRAAKAERCDGYYCNSGHGPQEPQAPGLLREIVFNAAGGFCGWRDVVPGDDEIAAVTRAQHVLLLGEVQEIINRAAGDL